MNFKQLVLSTAGGLGMILGAAAAQATPIDYFGTVSTGDALTIKYSNYEAFVNSAGVLTSALAPGDQNFGIFYVASIHDDTTGQNVWLPGVTNQQIFGVFNGITVQTITGAAPNLTTLNTGGVFDFYVLPGGLSFNQNSITGQGLNGYSNAGCALNTLCYNQITNTGETTDLQVNLVPGIVAGDPTTTLLGNVNGNTVPITGSAQADGQNVGGNDTGEFGKTVFIQDDFCVPGAVGCTAASGNWPENSQDPATAVAVPEPGTLTIFGTALLFLGFFGMKRNRNRA